MGKNRDLEENAAADKDVAFDQFIEHIARLIAQRHIRETGAQEPVNPKKILRRTEKSEFER